MLLCIIGISPMVAENIIKTSVLYIKKLARKGEVYKIQVFRFSHT